MIWYTNLFLVVVSLFVLIEVEIVFFIMLFMRFGMVCKVGSLVLEIVGFELVLKVCYVGGKFYHLRD